MKLAESSVDRSLAVVTDPSARVTYTSVGFVKLVETKATVLRAASHEHGVALLYRLLHHLLRHVRDARLGGRLHRWQQRQPDRRHRDGLVVVQGDPRRVRHLPGQGGRIHALRVRRQEVAGRSHRRAEEHVLETVLDADAGLGDLDGGGGIDDAGFPDFFDAGTGQPFVSEGR